MIKKAILPLLIASLIVALPVSVQADATVDIIPPEPKALQTIEVTTQLTDENINAVYVEIQECNGNTGLCYSKVNETMSETTANVYTASVTLTHDDATYMQYTIVVQTDQGWITYEKDTKVTYDTASGSTNGGSNDNDTPGFEFIGIALSIMFISFILYRRKR